MFAMKLVEWNINQRGGVKVDNLPLWILDEVDNDADIIVFTEFNSSAENFDDFCDLLCKKGYNYRKSDAGAEWGNSVLIAVKKDFPIVETVYFDAYPSGASDFSIPENLRVDIKLAEQIISIFGIRVKTLKGNYELRKNQLNTLIKWIKKIKNPIIVIGDFNNALHRGDLSKTFNDVKKEYYRAEYDKISNRWKKVKRDHYVYNLHILKDVMKKEGMDIIEDFDEKGISYFYENAYGTFGIHNDHLFISEDIYEKADVSFDWNFVNEQNGYGELKWNGGKSEEAGLPDHAILKASLILHDSMDESI